MLCPQWGHDWQIKDCVVLNTKGVIRSSIHICALSELKVNSIEVYPVQYTTFYLTGSYFVSSPLFCLYMLLVLLVSKWIRPLRIQFTHD